MRTIYLNTANYRDISSTPDVIWETIAVEVPDTFQGGNKTYDTATNTWLDTPAPPHDYVNEAEGQKTGLINEVNDFINSKQWPGKAALGRLTDAEKSDYVIAIDFLDAVNAVNTSSAPDIIWPEKIYRFSRR